MLIAALAIGTGVFAILLDRLSNPESLSRGRVSISSFYLYLYLIFYAGGGVYVYLTTTQNNTFLAALLLGLMLPPILFALYSGMRRTRRERRDKVSISPEYGPLTKVTLWTAVGAAGIGVIWYFSQASIPLVALLQGMNADEVRVLRAAAKFGVRFAYLYHALYAVFHIVSLLSFIRWLRRRSFSQFTHFLALFLITSAIYLATSEKGPLFFYWASVAFAYVFEQGSVRVARSVRLFLLVLSLVVLVSVTMLTYGYSDFSAALELIMSRVFLYQVVGPATTYDLIPRYLDFLYGRSYHLPSFIIPDRFSLESYLFYLIFGGVGSGTAPPGVLANGYANFGFLAAIGEYSAVLLVFYAMESRLCGLKDEMSIATRAWLTQYASGVIFAGSSTAVVLSADLMLVVVFYFVVRSTLRYPSESVLTGRFLAASGRA